MFPPLDPVSHLDMLCQYTIQVYSIKDLLGPWGGGGGTYFYNKNSDDPIFVIFDRKCVSINTRFFTCNRIKTKAGLIQQYLLCSVL